MADHIPKVEDSGKFNFITSIWIVPIVALFIAAWLAYQYYSELGPEIKITFLKNEGLSAGQSVIKYKNVVVGKVTKVQLNSNGESVSVHARMDKSVTPFLNENTKFWIVRPEVSVGGVYGLDTLISGTYIDMYAEKNGKQKDEFIGLPNRVIVDRNGEYYQLHASRGYNIQSGTPVYYNNIEVGQVEYVTLALDGRGIEIYIFIEKPYDTYVHTDSKFWVNSTVNIDLTSSGVDVSVAPISQLVKGGISFSSTGEDATRKVPEKFAFYLYKNESIVEEKNIGKGGNAVKIYELHTIESIAKLKIDASIRFKGYDVGHVTHVSTSYDPVTHHMVGTVYLKIDTSFFLDKNDENITGETNFHKAVVDGLRAKITQTDPITGLLYIDLVFDENVSFKPLVMGEKHLILPALEHEEGNIVGQFGTLLTNLNKLLDSTGKIVDENREPIRKILLSLKETTEHINEIVAQKEMKELPEALGKSMKNLSRTLYHANKVLKSYDEDSLRSSQLAETLRVVTEASKEMTKMLKMLNRNPNALILGDK